MVSWECPTKPREASGLDPEAVHLGNWEISHGYINGDFAYMLVFLSVAAFGAGRILGVDQYIEAYDVGGETLIERYPWLRYVLG